MGRVVWGSLGQFGVVCIEEENIYIYIYIYIFFLYIYIYIYIYTVPAISNLTFLLYAYGMVLHMVSYCVS